MLEIETFNLQDRDETETFQKTSRDRLEIETFKTETTSLQTNTVMHYCAIQLQPKNEEKAA